MAFYKIQVSQVAEYDLSAIFAKIDQEAPAMAKRWLRKIRKAISSLSFMPNRCPVMPELQEIGYGCSPSVI